MVFPVYFLHLGLIEGLVKDGN